MKRIYWYILGAAAIIAVGVYGKKQGWFGESKSNAVGGCPNSDGSPPQIGLNPGDCAEYTWNTTTCDWECSAVWAANGFDIIDKKGVFHKPTPQQLAAKKKRSILIVK